MKRTANDRQDDSANVNKVVFETIRDGLANGSITGDPTLSESHLEEKVRELNANLKFSRLHIRRAIAALESERLLVVFPKKGTQLRVLSNSELKEIWDNRVAIEEFVLLRLAVNRKRNLDEAWRINEKLQEVANLPFSGDKHQEFLRLDKMFHESLANAAGYPGLAQELSMLRLKLQVAAPVRRFDNDDRYFAVFHEHQRILEAIGSAQVLPRSDLNAVRLAFLVHMKNSSRDSWKIESRIRESVFCSQSNALDAPEFETEIARELMPMDNLLQMRLNTEYCAVGLLAARPGVDLSVIAGIQSEMQAMLKPDSRKPRADSDELSLLEQLKYLDLDISFHSALCYCAGMLFGEDVVSYTWHQVWKNGKQTLNVGRCKAILQDHELILNAIRRSDGSDADIQRAKDAIENHLFGTFVRNNFESEILRRAILEEERHLTHLKKVLELLDDLPHNADDRNSFLYRRDEHKR